MTEKQQISYKYAKPIPDIDDLNADPFVQFRYWFDAALKAQPGDANAMVLANADTSGRSSARVILLINFLYRLF